MWRLDGWGAGRPKRKEGEWGETIQTNRSRDGLRLKSVNLRRCCRLQEKGAVQGRSESRWRDIAHRRGGREARLAREHDAFLGHEMRGPAGTGRGGVSMAGGRKGQSARKGNGTNWSSDGLRLNSDNLRRCCRLQDRGAVQGQSEKRWRDSLIVAAGERRGSLGVGFENMMRSWVMK